MITTAQAHQVVCYYAISCFIIPKGAALRWLLLHELCIHYNLVFQIRINHCIWRSCTVVSGTDYEYYCPRLCLSIHWYLVCTYIFKLDRTPYPQHTTLIHVRLMQKGLLSYVRLVCTHIMHMHCHRNSMHAVRASDMTHRCRKMMKDGEAQIILTTPISDLNHAHFCIIEAAETGKQAFLDRRTSSKSSRAYCCS